MTKSVSFEELTYLSADGKTTVHAYLWIPTHCEPRAIVQLAHGMCEYVSRYDEWARRFAAEGIVFCGNDHLGHGHTAAAPEDLGHTAARGGADFLVEDLYTLTKTVKARFEGLPLFLYGHSMGSFVARLYLTRYGEDLTGALLSGTAGPEAPTGIALTLAHGLARAKGVRHRSKFITSLAFGAYNKRFGEEKDPNSWLTRVKEVRERYQKDPFCHFVFTLGGYDTLFSLLGAVSSKHWAENVPKHLPIFLFSGEMDPVGNYGRGIQKIYRRLTETGCNVTQKLYPGGRHEMHNEENRDEVFADIMDFLSKIPMPVKE
ncbi:MAG: lysophospholipase [Clostridia bacterium]|nr:lysophospholipase [Clostridia bacterium]